MTDWKFGKTCTVLGKCRSRLVGASGAKHLTSEAKAEATACETPPEVPAVHLEPKELKKGERNRSRFRGRVEFVAATQIDTTGS